MRFLHELMELRVEDGVFGLCAVVSLTQSENWTEAQEKKKKKKKTTGR